MSISSSMYTGISGLMSHSSAMSVISDNIANVNTVGFKGSRANFSDVLGGVVAGETVGAGSQISEVQTVFNQGSLLGTGRASDLAIRGEGFFIVSPPGSEASYYTRAGSFDLDKDGYITNGNGARMQGYLADATGNVSMYLQDMRIDKSTLPPTATTEVEVDANLDNSTEVSATAFDPDDPVATSDYTTSVTVYDSLGGAHQIEMFFKKTADTPSAEWDVHVMTAASDVDPAPAGDRALLGSGTLSFGTDGSLTSNTLGSISPQWAGADLATIDLNMGTGTGAGGTGIDGITSYASPSAVSNLSQDGNTSGEFNAMEFNENGQIMGLYSNGENRVLGQIATARFSSVSGLARQGDGLFRSTIDSGDAMVGAPGEGAYGALVSGSLEASNVDLPREFVNMITVQRGFQSNSRTITTADEMMSEVNSLKR